MALPIAFPNVQGPGRLTEVVSFRKADISDEEFYRVLDDITEKSSKFPIARQNMHGHQAEDPQIAVMIADWTSAAGKDSFAPGEEYQSVAPGFLKIMNTPNPSVLCHHLILPGAGCTPQCDIYTVSHMTIPESKQAELAAMFNTYLASTAAMEGLEYLAVAASREDPKVVVCVAGFKDEATAQRVGTTPEYATLQAGIQQLVDSSSKYRVLLKTVAYSNDR